LRCFGRKIYDIAILWNIIKSKNHSVTLTIDGEKRAPQDFSMVLVQNNQHGGSDLRTAPYAQMNDGVLDLLWFEHKSGS
jgi:diacylglycerol kinase family enzyme